MVGFGYPVNKESNHRESEETILEDSSQAWREVAALGSRSITN